MSDNKKYTFDKEEGKYNAKSTRYQTKRNQEKVENFEKMKKEFIELQNKLMNKDSYLDEQVKLFEKRFKTLKRYFSINKKVNEDLLIPFFINQKTIVYIQESNCYKDKWVALFGVEKIKDKIEMYKKILIHNTNNELHWNPF